MSPLPAAVEARHAPARAARSCRPAACPAGTSTSASPSSVGTVIRVAERQLREADRDLGVQVGAVALEALVGLDAQDDVEVARAGRRAAPPRRAPTSRRVEPSSTPAGIVICSVSSC